MDTSLPEEDRQLHECGVTAVSPTPAPIAVTEPPPSTIHNAILLSSNPYVLLPVHRVHATQPIVSNHLISRYLSRVTRSTSYLADPLNSYAHLRMSRPFLHSMEPLLGNALDALRPMLCERTGERKMGKEKESIGVVKET